MKRTHSLAVTLSLFVATAIPLAAYSVPAREFAETASVRESILNSWLVEEIDPLRALAPVGITDRFGYAFDVSQKKTVSGDEVEVTVAPGVRSGAQGVWTLTRRLSDGAYERISVYPVADPNVRVDVRPDGPNPEKGRSRLDLVVYGAYAARDVTVDLPFTALMTVPFSTVVALTARTVPWELADPDPSRYGDVDSMIVEIREKLPTLVYLDDGAFDENYRPVLIETGKTQDVRKVLEAIPVGVEPGIVVGGVNCSGFAKWIIDGIVRPEAGQGTFIAPMKGRTDAPATGFTEPVRESRDLFFALDWVRNLASAAESLRVGRTVRPDSSGVNVTVDTFPGSTPFAKNVGYRVSELYPLLYALAIREPGNFYLGAISRERGNPPMRQYHHVVALFPRFDRNGLFSVAAFESAVETPCDEFIARNSDAFAYLVRVRAPEGAYFEP